jgi:hypothetical protein
MIDSNLEKNALLNFIRRGQLGLIGVKHMSKELFTLIDYKDEEDSGKIYPSLQSNELLDNNIRFVIENDVIVVVTVRFNQTKPAPSKLYGITWYEYARKLNITDFEKILQSLKIPYWLALYQTDNEVDEISIQTKGSSTTFVQFFESGCVSHITYLSNGLHHQNSEYPRLIDPTAIEL